METYQEAWSPAGTVPGDRDCAARWPLIEPHLPDRGMVLDVGSNLGYFGLRAVAERPGVAVVSIEADPHIASLQGALAREHGDGRVAVLRGDVSSASISAWSEVCDWFDLTLLLSILHWLDDPAAVVRSLSSMSARMLCEVPDPADDGACGQGQLAAWADPVQWFTEVTGRPCRAVGRMERHTSTVPSHLVLVEGPTRRVVDRAYWSEEAPVHPGGYRFDYDGHALGFTARGRSRRWIPGVNVLDLMKVGALVAPDPPWWSEAARAELLDHPEHPDPLPHNMVWGPDGIRLIDFDEDVDALHTAADGARTLEANLRLWVAGATVDARVALRTLTWAHRLRYSRGGKALYRVLPAAVARAVRTAARRLGRIR